MCVWCRVFLACLVCRGEQLPKVVDRLNAKHGEGTVVYEERQAEDNTLVQRSVAHCVWCFVRWRFGVL